jgi:hypothetical protein
MSGSVVGVTIQNFSRPHAETVRQVVLHPTQRVVSR